MRSLFQPSSTESTIFGFLVLYSQTIEFIRSLTTLHVLQYMYIPAIPDILGASHLEKKTMNYSK